VEGIGVNVVMLKSCLLGLFFIKGFMFELNQESKVIILQTLKIESLDEIVDRDFLEDSDVTPEQSELFKQDFQLP
jgi:hypothetical protein